mmetsp:Transcript_22324/g.75495  ORF Transcript_22324/g.75495 Transcript_22324/m.75495 type:complete len:322 (-) Transcript_22324:2210-3175(-)
MPPHSNGTVRRAVRTDGIRAGLQGGVLLRSVLSASRCPALRRVSTLEDERNLKVFRNARARVADDEDAVGERRLERLRNAADEKRRRFWGRREAEDDEALECVFGLEEGLLRRRDAEGGAGHGRGAPREDALGPLEAAVDVGAVDEVVRGPVVDVQVAVGLEGRRQSDGELVGVTGHRRRRPPQPPHARDHRPAALVNGDLVDRRVDGVSVRPDVDVGRPIGLDLVPLDSRAREKDGGVGAALLDDWVDEEVLADEPLVVQRQGGVIKRVVGKQRPHHGETVLARLGESGVPVRQERVSARDGGAEALRGRLAVDPGLAPL